MSQQLVKARLFSLDDPQYDIDFMFNPTQLDFSRGIKLNQPQGARSTGGQPKVSFAAPDPCTITLSKITFDTYEDRISVLPYIEQLLKAMRFLGEPDRSATMPTGRPQSPQARRGTNQQRNQRPPLFLLIWGANDYLRCFVESCKYQLTLFLPDGTPVRAVVNLTLKEVDESAMQGNPRAITPEDRFGDRQRRLEQTNNNTPGASPPNPLPAGQQQPLNQPGLASSRSQGVGGSGQQPPSTPPRPR